jgi:hypothetical protein
LCQQTHNGGKRLLQEDFSAMRENVTRELFGKAHLSEGSHLIQTTQGNLLTNSDEGR